MNTTHIMNEGTPRSLGDLASDGVPVDPDFLDALPHMALRYLTVNQLPKDKDHQKLALEYYIYTHHMGYSQLRAWGQEGPITYTQALAQGEHERRGVLEQGNKLIAALAPRLDVVGAQDVATLGLDLALPHAEIISAKNELAAAKRSPSLLAVRGLLQQAAENRALTETVAYNVFAANKNIAVEDIPKRFDTERYFQLPHQARLVRGALSAAMLRGMRSTAVYGVGYLSDEAMDDLIDAASRLRRDGAMLQRMRDILVSELAPVGQDAVASRVFGNYIDQINQACHNWARKGQRVTGMIRSQRDDTRYRDIFRLLPLDPVSISGQFGFESQTVDEHERKGQPHLWEHSVIIGGLKIPSRADFNRGVSLIRGDLRDRRIDWESKQERNTLLSRLMRAERAWARYSKIIDGHPVKIAAAERELASLPRVDRATPIVVPEQTAHEASILSHQIANARRVVSGYMMDLEVLELANSAQETDGLYIAIHHAFSHTSRIDQENRLQQALKGLTHRPTLLDFALWEQEGHIDWHALTNQGLEQKLDQVNYLINFMEKSGRLPTFYTDHVDAVRARCIQLQGLIEDEQERARYAKFTNPHISLRIESQQRDLIRLLLTEARVNQEVIMRVLAGKRKLREINATIRRNEEYRFTPEDKKRLYDKYMELKRGIVDERVLSQAEHNSPYFYQAQTLMTQTGKARRGFNTRFTLNGSRLTVERQLAAVLQRAQRIHGKQDERVKLVEGMIAQAANPLFPFDISGEVSIGQFFTGAQKRTRVFNAFLVLGEEGRAVVNLKSLRDQAEYERRIIKARNITAQAELYRQELVGAESHFLAEMRLLGFAVAQ